MTDILVYTEEQGNVIAGSVQPDRMVVAVLGAVGAGGGGGGAVSSVNGQIGHVVLDAADVGADPAGTGASAAASAVAAHEAALDPHPQYTTAAEAAAAAPVQSVNGETGVVVLSATDVGADVAGAAAAAVVAHEAALDPHPQYLTQTEGDARYERGLTAGTNVTIDRTDPDNPVISAVGGGGGAVDSVNGQTGAVVLDAADVGADVAGTAVAEAEDARFQSTGLISGGALAINADNTKFNVAAGVAVFTDYSNPSKSTATIVPFGPFTAVTVPNLATSNVSYIGITSAGTIVQQTTRFSNTQRRSIVSLGAVVHSNRANINAINTIVTVNRQLLNQFGDGIRAIGQLNLSGNVYSAVGASLQMQRSAGELFSPGANFHTNPDDPHAALLSAANPVSLRYRLQNGTEYADRTTIDPSQYDNAGVLTVVPANKFTVQLISVFQSGVTRMQYGQALYNNISEAVAAAQGQSMTLEQNIAENGVIRAYLAIKSGATALNDTAQAVFVNLSKFNAASTVAPLALSTTDELAEGVSNLYYTNARADSRAAAAVATHEAAADPHPQYLTPSEGNAAYAPLNHAHALATTSSSGFMSPGDKTKLDSVQTGAVAPAQVVEYTGTAKTLALTDNNTIVDCTSASAVTITIPPQASVAWAADAEIHVRMSGTGVVSIAVGAGVTIPPLAAPIALSGHGAMVTLKRRSSDVWAVVGSVVGGPDVVGPASSVDNEIARFDGATGKRIKGSASGGAFVGGTASYVSLVVSRLDQSGAGNNDRALMDIQTSTGSARFIYNDPAGPITRGMLVPRTGGPSWWDGTNNFNLFNGEYGGQVIRDTGALGFGTGSGGTVTQATSKTTAVTLNKPSGRITTAADALAAGAGASFQMNNSSIGATDVVVANVAGTTVNYRIEVLSTTAGVVRLRLSNISAGSLSDAVVINFVVIKGAIA